MLRFPHGVPSWQTEAARGQVFRRRDRPAFALRAARALWPRGGWHRAFLYIRHRVRRLPDTPEKIARGIWAGVFTTFTPFYGLHFILSLILARLMNGNILAALLATFFGNPLTYVSHPGR